MRAARKQLGYIDEARAPLDADERHSVNLVTFLLALERGGVLALNLS